MCDKVMCLGKRHELEDKKIKLLFKKSSRFHYMEAGIPKNTENYVQPKENR